MKISLVALACFVSVFGEAFFFFAAFVAAAEDGCHREKLYAVSGDKSIKIKTNRGTASVIASYNNKKLSSIEYDHASGRMYGLAAVENSDHFELARLNPERGGFDPIGHVRRGSRGDFLVGLAGLAMDETTSTMYTYSQADTSIWQLDLGTGNASPVFVTGVRGIIDIASHPRTGVIYATTGSGLYAIDRKRHRVRIYGGGVSVEALWFDRSGILYGIRGQQPSGTQEAEILEIDVLAPRDQRTRALGTAAVGYPVSGVTLRCEASKEPKWSNENMNILMIVIDDMNDWVGHLGGHPNAYTPNLDALANKSVAFLRAHAASTVCLASRTATLYGQRPTKTGIYDNGIDWHAVLGNDTSMLEHFKQNGFDTIGIGKIFHGVRGLKEDVSRPKFWTRYTDVTHDDFYLDEDLSCLSPEQNIEPEPDIRDQCIHGVEELCESGLNFGPSETCEQKVADYQRASWIIERLQENYNNRFFMALGLTKPHLPLVLPQKYFDMIPLKTTKLPLTKPDDLADLPYEAKRLALDLGEPGYGLHDAIKESQLWKEAVQAYLSAIAFADEMIGRVTDALEKSKYRENTILVLWSDHGFHLGEKKHWRKGTLWEESTRVPFIIHVPGLTDHGIPCEHPVDLMSIFPTLVGLTGVPRIDVDGQNLVRLLMKPHAEWKHSAIMTYRRHNVLRAGRWRYIRYYRGGEELYDMDTDVHEWNNLALDPAYNDTIQMLRERLPKHQARPVATI